MRALPFRRAVAPFTIVLLASIAVATTVGAQLGAIRRAAERRVEKKADDRIGAATLIEPTFDNTTLEINAERLDRYQAAMEQRKAQQVQNRAAYEALDRRVSVTRDSAHIFDNQREREAYEASVTRYDECRSGIRTGIEAAQEKKAEDIIARMQANPMAAQNDPQMKRIMTVMQELALAQQRGDAAATQVAMAKYAEIMGGAADSVSLDRAAATRCGGRPSRPASMVRYAQHNTRADSLYKVGQELLGANTGVKGAAVGMTDIQARMFWERIASWLVGMRDDAPITKTFSRSEYDLLVARRSVLRKAWYGSE
ncbi:MAG: hypothetical protein H7099_06310 [Gemmatimonadaceae bacterium]|nr:hypothetical protein [Gemmatimonadaceae bacterium]